MFSLNFSLPVCEIKLGTNQYHSTSTAHENLLAAILKYWLLDPTLTNPVRISGGGDWASTFTALV